MDTINANCCHRAAAYIKSTAADFVVTQEARVQGSQARTQAESAMATAKWKTYIGPCITTEAFGTSSGVAVSCRSHIGLADRDATDTLKMSANLRSGLQICHVGAVFKRGIPPGIPLLALGDGDQRSSKSQVAGRSCGNTQRHSRPLDTGV